MCNIPSIKCFSISLSISLSISSSISTIKMLLQEIGRLTGGGVGEEAVFPSVSRHKKGWTFCWASSSSSSSSSSPSPSSISSSSSSSPELHWWSYSSRDFERLLWQFGVGLGVLEGPVEAWLHLYRWKCYINKKCWTNSILYWFWRQGLLGPCLAFFLHGFKGCKLFIFLCLIFRSLCKCSSCAILLGSKSLNLTLARIGPICSRFVQIRNKMNQKTKSFR